MKPFGLYIHIPFCASLCHYCDFAKTANFSEDKVKEYFRLLEEILVRWLAQGEPEMTFSSVFFGGGTPGLFQNEYHRLFEILHPKLAADAEITLEANPTNVTRQSLRVWRGLGINRLSIGVQSFDPIGLKTMTRDHSSEKAKDAITLALETMPSVNADLIYAWPGQTVESWRSDLATMLALEPHHLSLYALTLEGKTPFARAQRRGALQAMGDEEQETRYEIARELLSERGYDHEEVSNWAKPGHSCRHNWLYWRGSYYLGIGSGAHGYLPSGLPWGMRYAFASELRTFLRLDSKSDLRELVDIESDRNAEAWMIEYVGSALRCREGVNLQLIQAMGYLFRPSSLVYDALRHGRMIVDDQGIRLPPSEWFREIGWSRILLDCFFKTRQLA